MQWHELCRIIHVLPANGVQTAGRKELVGNPDIDQPFERELYKSHFSTGATKSNLRLFGGCSCSNFTSLRVCFNSNTIQAKTYLVALLVQVLVAVLMAVRFQLLCILLQRTARAVSAATYTSQSAYATICDRLQLAAKAQKTDSKSAGLRPVGVRPPLPAPNKTNNLS